MTAQNNRQKTENPNHANQSNNINPYTIHLACWHPGGHQEESSSKNLNYTIAARTDNESSISAPNNAANALAAHNAMASKFLSTYTFFEVPEADAGVVAGGDCFATVLTKR
jgi:hypothetical protein